MTYRTHILGGVAIGAVVTTAAGQGYFGLTPLSTPAIFGTFIAAMFGSVFPDIDQPKSKIGQQIPILSKLMRGTFGHRGFCHSLLFLLILHFLVVRFLPSMAFYSLVFCLGASTHLFFDMFNSPGVPLFWPVKIRVRIAKSEPSRNSTLKRPISLKKCSVELSAYLMFYLPSIWLWY